MTEFTKKHFFARVIYIPYYHIMKIFRYDCQIEKFILSYTRDNRICDSILDIGCGPGVVGLTLSKIYPKATITFTDINVGFLKKIEAKLNNKQKATFGISDISQPNQIRFFSGERKAFKDQTFDIISAGANIGYSSDLDSAILTLYQMLKPGGYIINLEMNNDFWGKLISRVYGYRSVSLKNISSSLRSTNAVVSAKPIPKSFFPLGLTRQCIIIKKPNEK